MWQLSGSFGARHSRLKAMHAKNIVASVSIAFYARECYMKALANVSRNEFRHAQRVFCILEKGYCFIEVFPVSKLDVHSRQ